MTTGLTHCWTGGDSAVEARLSATDGVETTIGSNASEMAVAQPSVGPSIDPSAGPSAEANVADANAKGNADSWRVEVAARLERYRTRRKPRTPRYPSLRLPFDAPESWSRPGPASGAGAIKTAVVLTEKEFGFQASAAPAETTDPDFAGPRRLSKQDSEQAPDSSAKVIEFPRSAAIPVFHPSDLADPVFDRNRPRIVEAPEILPPPPALGGMLMDPARKEPVERQAGTDFPFASTSIARRVLAALVDGAILATALTAFGAIFLRLNPNLNAALNPIRQPLPILAAVLAVAAIALWAAYEFLFVVYTGSTPGLRAARLRLAAFDGSPLNRRVRRWRVLASLLSALSVGLGYLWCLLDQDGLCWHDRITRTSVQLAVRQD